MSFSSFWRSEGLVTFFLPGSRGSLVQIVQMHHTLESKRRKNSKKKKQNENRWCQVSASFRARAVNWYCGPALQPAGHLEKQAESYVWHGIVFFGSSGFFTAIEKKMHSSSLCFSHFGGKSQEERQLSWCSAERSPAAWRRPGCLSPRRQKPLKTKEGQIFTNIHK